MMFTQKNLMTVCCAAVLAFGLAACGGGGGGGDAPVTSMINGNGPPPEGPPEPGLECATSATSQGCVDEKNMAMDEAKEALDAAKADENSTQKQIADAQEAYDDAKMAHMTAMEGRATYLAMQPPMYDMKAMAKAFEDPTDDHVVADAIDGGALPMDDKAYAKATWPVGDVAGFAEAVYEDASAGTAIITHTDKSAAKGVTYKKLLMPDTAPVDAPAGYMYMTRSSMGIEDDSIAGVLTLRATVPPTAMISFAHDAGIASLKTFSDVEATADVDESVVSIMGTFHGVQGTYACGTAGGENACMAGTDEKGVLITLSAGNWTFTPAKGAEAGIIAGAQTDAEYLDFGYWVTTTDDPTAYSVGTFAKGMGNTSGPVMTALIALMGDPEAMSATYKGGAAGLYAKREYSGTAGDGDLLGAGRFTATAELKAYFGTGIGTAMDDHNTISGMISSFMDDGSPIDATWRVKLEALDFESSTDGSFGDAEDSWSGQFIGGSGTTADDVTAPTGVAGEFTHEFANGNVIGAFGATR